MTLPTHFLLGAILGKITGNYTASIASSVLIDLDHLQSYVEHKVLWKPKKLWDALTDQKDHWGDQRGMLHNVLLASGCWLVLILIFHKVGLLISIGWLGHICLDALDNSDYWPFYPNKSVNLRGPIKYGSWQELIFFIGLIGIYFYI